ncbi:MAG: MBOAT family protein [Solirubrobacteraceae bacterium]|nr:MBOAT family protein [Solirubrobacteraceae bacterium]
MVFSSPTFLFLFLPAVLLATWAAPTRLRRFVLLAASIGFYTWGVQDFVLLIIASTTVDWALARAIQRARRDGRGRLARGLLLVGLVQNLGLLAWFKYAGFLSEQVERIADAFGMGHTGTLEILLPIGISFFTFEKVSYLVDVWRGDVEARRDPTDVLLFVFLFPRSIAGPIVRLREIQDDLRRPQPRVDLAQAGAIRFSHGLAKKVLIADQIAPVADAAFASAADGSLTTGSAWLGIVAYSLQLYFDFSAYSDMAIGIGMMLGFRLPENFDRPYSSKSITEFWRRWHMTLSRWFRDYVYIPLGGNRGSEATTRRNLVIVFALTGMWHGAEWAFVLWGLYHGAWLLIERRMGWRALDGPVRLPWLRRAAVLFIVLIGWVLFRAESLSLAGDYYHAMFVPTGGDAGAVDVALTNQALAAMLVGAAIAFLPGTMSGGRRLVETVGPRVATARTVLLAVVLPLALVTAFASDYSPFLYFQF